ncbi:MAG: helix-turn-helix transcriptional regulator [Ruminococcaceae bacterium]|nr:helix-turn-helix transcriptional regulator [Oscillospiraceae bacterium]
MRIKDLREDADLTQQTIADYLNIKQNTYCQYENKQRQIPVELLIKLSEYYNVSVDYILDLTDVKEPYERKKTT